MSMSISMYIYGTTCMFLASLHIFTVSCALLLPPGACGDGAIPGGRVVGGFFWGSYLVSRALLFFSFPPPVLSCHTDRSAALATL